MSAASARVLGDPVCVDKADLRPHSGLLVRRSEEERGVLAGSVICETDVDSARERYVLGLRGCVVIR